MPKKRPVASLPLLPVLHIYCEGEKTEPNYLNSYIGLKFPRDCRRRNVVKVEPTKKNTPVQLVDVAVAHKNSRDCPSHDIFWVVYDRESASKYPDSFHLKAYNKAQKNGVKIALSNVCFEVWLYLHFQANTAPFASYDDFMNQSQFKYRLAEVGINSYEKGDKSFFEAIQNSHIVNARNRATSMNSSTLASAPSGVIMPHLLNPYTDMHLLLDSIDSF